MPSKHRMKRLADRQRKGSIKSTQCTTNTSSPTCSPARSTQTAPDAGFMCNTSTRSPSSRSSPCTAHPTMSMSTSAIPAAASASSTTASQTAQPQQLLSSLQWNPGVHEHSFTHMKPDEVLQGMVSISTMDYVTQLLNTQFLTSRQYTPSCLYSVSLNNQQLPNKVPRCTDYVQIHFYSGHFLVSCQKNGQMFVYDSMQNKQHVYSLRAQLDVLYEHVNIPQVQYKLPQLQGDTNLCALFATANALTLLMGGDPMNHRWDISCMRTHLRDCLKEGQIRPFPQEEPTRLCVRTEEPEGDLLTNYFRDQNLLQAKKFAQSLKSVHVCDQQEKRRQQVRKSVQKKRLDSEYRQKEQAKQKQEKQQLRKDPAYWEKKAEREKQTRTQKRKDPVYRQQESEREKQTRRQKRKNPVYRQQESEREKQTRRQKRKNPVYRQQESESEKQTRRQKRKDPAYRQRESEREKQKRKNPVYRQQESEREKQIRRQKRKNPVYRQQESESEKQTRRQKRKDPAYRHRESEREKQKRKNPGYRQQESEREKQTRRQKRKDPAYRQRESEREKQKRKNPVYRQQESEREKQTRRQKRKNPAYRQRESERETPTKRMKRHTDLLFRETERLRELELIRARRAIDKNFRRTELARDRSARSKRRQNPTVRQREQVRDKKMKQQGRSHRTLQELVHHFHKEVSEGPTYICSCCEQLWYRTSVVMASSVISLPKAEECLQGVVSENGKEWICQTCRKHIKANKTPPCAIVNGMAFPDIPADLQGLHTLELRLVAPRIPFMKIFQAPRGQQFKVHGNVVNVPSNVVQTISTLPRLQDQDGTIKVKLKRRLTYKSSVMNESIRPHKVMAAAKWLVENSPLYIRENITLDDNWTYLPTVVEDTTGETEEETTHAGETEETTHAGETEETTHAGETEETTHAGETEETTHAGETEETTHAGETEETTHAGETEETTHAGETEETTHAGETEETTHAGETEETTHAGETEETTHAGETEETTHAGETEETTHAGETEERSAAHITHGKVDIDSGTSQNKDTVTPDTNNNTTDTTDASRAAWDEVDDTDIHGGKTDTLFTDPNFVEADERGNIWCFAPGQFSQPVSVFKDLYCEELSFPGIFSGQPRSNSRATKVYYSEIVKSELRRRDRRVAKCVDNIFFKTKKLQMQLIYGKTQIAIRKYKLKDKKLTAGSLKHQSAISDLVHLDEGYRVLRSVRGSPPYFEKAKKDLFAMIRVLGSATFFMSFSAAETRWIHLLKILSKTVNEKELTDDDVEALTWQDKCHLIQSDPVTCSRHFHHSVQCLLKFFRSDLSPLGGTLKDFFYRVEYQHRGSPHIHMLVWVDGAPQYTQTQDSAQRVTGFVDRIISCSSDHDKADMQIHRHSRTCNRGNKCRFNYPQPPLRKTAVLTPIDDPLEQEEPKKNYKIIKAHLDQMKLGEDLELDEFFGKLKMSEEQYLLALRSSISAPTLFLKRSPKDIRVNAYNPVCLSAWRANMDAQFILDIYACAMYVVGYISKSQRGMSLLLDRACKEAREKGSSIREQVSLIGNKFANNVEISSQEAVDLCLQNPLRQASRQVVFVPTSPSNERTYFLKSTEEISQLDDDSEDVAAGNIIKRYSNRPKTLEAITLADWASSYDSVRQKAQESKSSSDEDEDDVQPPPVKHGRKRKVPHILRYVRYNKDTHQEEFYRERILLFTPWRDESKLIGSCETYQDRYNELELDILQQLQIYEPNAAEVDQAEKQAAQDLQEQWDQIAPNTEHENQRDIDKGIEPSHAHDVLDPPDSFVPSAGIPTTATATERLPFDEMPDDEHRAFIRSLNKKQQEFFTDILYRIKTTDEPFYAFLSGGAGVGKSRLLTAIYQTAMKYYNSVAGTDFNKQYVLVVAPTGKAAFNIYGNTIQSALKVLPNQRLNLDTPTSEKLNTLRLELGDTKLIIIDEISMVGLRLFTLVHRRMQDIKASGEDFAKISVVCFGDLFQFKPVFDCFLFSNDVQGINALATNLWQKHFTMYELTEIMRQKDSVHFAQILNRLREGKHTEEDIQVLETRRCDQFMPNYPTYAPHLFLENSRVASWNDDAFARSKKAKTICKAHDRVIGDVSLEIEARLKSQISDNPSKTMHLHTNLKVGLDLNFEVCMNINTKDGMTNGASGIVKHMDVPPSGIARKGIIWMQFPADKVGQQTRLDNRHLYRGGINKQWTPIVPVGRQLKVGRNGEIMRTQFPLRPSAAKTLHRAQGETFTEVVVDFSVTSSAIRPPFFEHAHYVGLSRVTSLEGLHILNLNKEKIATNVQVKTEMQRLRSTARYELQSKPIYSLSASIIVCYNNARSLHKHFDDCLNDPNIQATDICIFSETRFFPSESNTSYQMPGFSVFRNDDIPRDPALRPSHGSAVYYKMQPRTVMNMNKAGIELTVVIPTDWPDVTVIGVYKPPEVATSKLTKVLVQILNSITTSHAIVLGDMNSDLKKHPPLQLPTGYKQCIEGPTTDYRTSLDHIYTNLPNESFKTGKIETYWSDHKVIWISLNK